MGSNLKELVDWTYENKSWVAISENTTTIEGTTVYERIYKRPHGGPWYQIKDVWLEKNGCVAYIISCWALPANFTKSEHDFEVIINSFKTE